MVLATLSFSLIINMLIKCKIGEMTTVRPFVHHLLYIFFEYIKRYRKHTENIVCSNHDMIFWHSLISSIKCNNISNNTRTNCFYYQIIRKWFSIIITSLYSFVEPKVTWWNSFDQQSQGSSRKQRKMTCTMNRWSQRFAGWFPINIEID